MWGRRYFQTHALGAEKEKLNEYLIVSNKTDNLPGQVLHSVCYVGDFDFFDRCFWDIILSLR